MESTDEAPTMITTAMAMTLGLVSGDDSAEGESRPEPQLGGIQGVETALAVLDGELRFVSVNSVFEQTTGRTRAELAGRGLTELWDIDLPGETPLVTRLAVEPSMTVDALPVDPASSRSIRSMSA